MEFKDIITIVGSFIISLGGGSAIVFGCSNRIGKFWADKLMEKERAEHSRALEALKNTFLKETESYKIKLKKSELLFEKQFEAASELVALNRSFIPEYNYPSMDWEDVCEHIIHQSENIEKKLNKYLSRYGAILGDDIVCDIDLCSGLAGEIKFENNEPIMEQTLTKAEELYNELKDAEKLLLEKVNSQTSI